MTASLVNFIFVTFNLADLLDGVFDDDGELMKDTLLGIHYDMKTAQEFAKSLPGYNHVYAFIDYNDQEDLELDPKYGLNVTDAKKLPTIYDDSLLPSLKESLPLYPNLPSEFRHVSADRLPLFGFCAGRAVNIRADRTGYVGKPRPLHTT
jgi:hypothetical protein